MRVEGGAMRRTMAAVVLALVTAGACGGSREARSRQGFAATNDTTTTIVVAPSVEGARVSPSVPAVAVTPSLPVPGVIVGASSRGSRNRGRWPHPGRGCRRAPFPRCSETARRPCCTPGDPANERFHAEKPLRTQA